MQTTLEALRTIWRHLFTPRCCCGKWGEAPCSPECNEEMAHRQAWYG